MGLTSYPDHMGWPGYEAKVGLTSYPDHMGWPGYEAKLGGDVQFSSVGMSIGRMSHALSRETKGEDCGGW